MKSLVIIVAATLAVAGCASIIDGTTQEIAVNTNPAGAKCVVNRKSVPIGTVVSTPGAVTIKKTKDDITVVCDKDGYQQATFMDHSGVAGSTYANIILGGGIGWAIDSSSGADNEYLTPINISMVPTAAPAQPATQAKP